MMKWTLSIFLGFLASCSHSQSQLPEKADEIIETSVLDSLGLDMEVARDAKYRFQFVASSIKEGKVQKAVSYGTDQYYFPASLVKLPAALVLLEILNEKNISLNAFPVFDTVQACGSTKFVDISRRQHVNFKQILEELLVVSDNHFYNAIYHFIPPEELNRRIEEKGFEGVKIYRAFTGCEPFDQLRTYPCKVYEFDEDPRPVYSQEAAILDTGVLSEKYDYSKERLFGSKHENSEGDIVDGPFDLNYQLEIPLDQVHSMMLSLYYPELFSIEKQWKIRSEDFLFLQDLLGMYPSEIKGTYRSLKRFDDFEYKYVLNKEDYAEGRTFGKLGLSYGFASETVYVPSEGVGNGVLLTYSVYVNSNDVVNDGEYDYETVARPFGEVLFAKVLEWHNK